VVQPVIPSIIRNSSEKYFLIEVFITHLPVFDGKQFGLLIMCIPCKTLFGFEASFLMMVSKPFLGRPFPLQSPFLSALLTLLPFLSLFSFFNLFTFILPFPDG